ncbi:hypothetical protein BHE74_00019021 [Ensete ventricosum]|nr:hypothetical protein GW17_00011633 [Ensete ventricosum]RWW73122.1 hypothetical protein BHE74_00019021 [Ensete ventricosum]RZS12911.1 hypothetical protein BHM03_00044417 [Ensete ventricosum]
MSQADCQESGVGGWCQYPAVLSGGPLSPACEGDLHHSFKMLLDNIAKNLVTVNLLSLVSFHIFLSLVLTRALVAHHFSMGLIDRVCNSGRVADKLSRIIGELRGEVQKLEEDASPVAVAVVKAQASEAT